MAQKPEPPNARKLDVDVPELKEYLAPGAKVLDVGCGSGTITRDVAARVNPGEVIGVDPVAECVDLAREWASHVDHSGNISFRVGDCHRLDFPDHTFDVVYSHTVAHFFLDPIKALEEQRRVTKPGGWVIASGVRDLGISVRYPRCPNWERAWEAWRRYNDVLRERFRSSGDGPAEYLAKELQRDVYFLISWESQAGRKCPHWFVQVGLRDLRVQIKGDFVQFPGAGIMQPGVVDFLPAEEPVSDPQDQRSLNAHYQRMVEQGYIDAETLSRAQQEAREWCRHPGAFNYWVLVFVAGRA